MNAGQRYGFACSACGKCCNSAPTLTLDELFHHEHRFVGCLTLRLVPPSPSPGAWIDGIEVSAATAAQWQALRQALTVPIGDAAVRLATRAYAYPSLGRCAALADDGRCQIHDDHKPVVCGTVPLDAELPDGVQRVVLHRRRADATSFDANCIREGDGGDAETLVAGDAIVDAVYRQAVDAQRRGLQDDVDRWGRDVARALATAAGTTSHWPTQGHVTLSLVPALAVLASSSPAMAARCRRHALAQVRLIEEEIEKALQRRQAADRPITAELRRFAQQYRAFAAEAVVATAD